MASYNIQIQGLDELKTRLEAGELNRRVILAASTAIKPIISALTSSVMTKYHTQNQDISRARTNLGGSTPIQTGINSIVIGIEYKFIPISMGYPIFPTTTEMGNINSWARRQGLVHTTAIIRKQPKVVHGKKHYGGFLYKKKYMMERSQKKTWVSKGVRAPIHPLFAPSVMKQVEMVFLEQRNDPSSKIGQAITEATNMIASELKL